MRKKMERAIHILIDIYEVLTEMRDIFHSLYGKQGIVGDSFQASGRIGLCKEKDCRKKEGLPPEKLLTVREAAETLQLSEDVLDELCRRQKWNRYLREGHIHLLKRDVLSVKNNPPPSFGPVIDEVKNLMTRKEVIGLLKIAPSTYTRWKQQGIIVSVSIGGRDYVRREDLKKAILESERRGKI